MSFQPGWPRSAWATRDPSGSRRSNRPSGDETITSRPSGSHAVHSGSDSTCAITSLCPARSTAITSPADQSEKYNRSPCQRGDSTRPRPVSSVRTSFILVTTLFKSRHVAGVPIPIRTTSSRIDRIERRDTTERGGCSVRHMAMHSVTHLALRVERLREAEAFYRGLFAMEVAFREAETPDGWWTLTQSAGWDDAGCRIVQDRAQALVFDAPFGVRWELNTFPYDDPPSLSTGARAGRWLEVAGSG